MDLKNKVVLVTGGSRGIGKEIARGFIREGAKVFICSRNLEEIKSSAEEISEPENKCAGIKCDVSIASEVKDAVKKALVKTGNIDILINNAGVGFYKPLTETTEKEWDMTMDINLKGPYLFSKECVPFMKKGIIVNISSGAGKAGFPNFTAYCASKFGLIGFSESLAGEFPHLNIYTLCPGPVNTELYRGIFGHPPPTQPEDIAGSVIDLCKKEDYPSGSTIDLF